MDKKGKKVFTSLAVLAGLASGAGALNMFVNRTVKAMLYRHHKEDDKPSILETKYGGKNVFIKNRQGIKLRGILITENLADITLVILHPFDPCRVLLSVRLLKRGMPPSFQAGLLL